MQQPIVRAVDVGYGHVKWTDGFDGEAILAEAFPSQSVVSQAAQHQSAVWQQRDTFLIPIKDRLFFKIFFFIFVLLLMMLFVFIFLFNPLRKKIHFAKIKNHSRF